ncbi:MAG: hypothetical protein ACKVIG_06920 [Flavobacteriales bacterium]
METNKYILDFEKALIDTKNKKYLIEKEIKQINKVIETDKPLFGHFGSVGPEVKTNSVFKETFYGDNYFNSLFHQYIEDGDFDFETIQDDKYKRHTDSLMKKVIPFADYYLWLKEKLQNFTENKTIKKSDLTLSQKVLSLHYLGLNLDRFDKTKSSKILSKILNQSEDNTRKYLNQLSSVTKESELKSTKNLNTLLELFENEQFKEVQNKIKKDIDNLG